MKNTIKTLVLIVTIPLFCSCASEKSAMIWGAVFQGIGQNAASGYQSINQQNLNTQLGNQNNPYFK